MKRREFIKKMLGATVALSTPWLLPGCRDSQSVAGPATNARVAAVRGNNLDAMARDAIDALGGMSTVVNSGETVFIKPNFVTFPWASKNDCFNTGECTKPEILIATVEECLKAGATEVIIGEGSHQPTFDWRHAVTFDGRTNLVAESQRLSAAYGGKVKLACLETDSPGWVEVPSSTPLGTIAISSLVAEADKVISIPVAKTHAWAQLTLASKNFLGVTPMSRYAQTTIKARQRGIRAAFDHSSPQGIGQAYLDITKSIQPDLTIIDFSVGMEGDGPTIRNGGMTVDMKDRLGAWAVLAGTDIMATEATAARMMSHDVKAVPHFAMAAAMGLGETGESAIEIVGEKLDNLRVPWKPARPRISLPV